MTLTPSTLTALTEIAKPVAENQLSVFTIAICALLAPVSLGLMVCLLCVGISIVDPPTPREVIQWRDTHCEREHAPKLSGPSSANDGIVILGGRSTLSETLSLGNSRATDIMINPGSAVTTILGSFASPVTDRQYHCATCAAYLDTPRICPNMAPESPVLTDTGVIYTRAREE